MSVSTACVQTELNYHLTPEQGGTNSVFPGTASYYRRTYDTQPASVEDLRSIQKECPATLDVQGFQLLKHTCSEKEWTDAARVKDVAYKETQELLMNATGATKVHVISHLVRRHTWESTQDLGKDLKDDDMVPLEKSGYTTNRFVHIDQSTEGSEALLREELSDPEEAERLAKGHWGIINVWRPIGRPIRREALTVCDMRTVSPADLHQISIKLPQTDVLTAAGGGVAQSGRLLTWAVSANPEHRWYYAKELTPEEVLLIRIYDSEGVEGKVRGTPHCAFVTEGDEGPPRESVEVRCLVFWENQ